MPRNAPVLARINTTQSTARSIPKHVLELLGPAALFPGETQADFDRLLLEVGSAVGAHDIIDWFSVNDVACLVWEARRLRSIKAALLEEARIDVIEQLLTATTTSGDVIADTHYTISGAGNDARRTSRDKAFAAQIEDKLASHGYSRSVVLARSYEICGPRLASLEKSISDCELRRMVAIAEVARRSESLAKRLSHATSDCIDGEFAEAAE